MCGIHCLMAENKNESLQASTKKQLWNNMEAPKDKNSTWLQKG